MRVTIIILTMFMINVCFLHASDSEQKKISEAHAQAMLNYKIRFIKGKTKILTDMKKEYVTLQATVMKNGDMDATMKIKEKIDGIQEQINDLTEELEETVEELNDLTETDY